MMPNMAKYPAVFRRQKDGGYKVEGELRKGTTWVTIEVGPRPSSKQASSTGARHRVTEAIGTIERAINAKQAVAEYYKLVPAAKQSED